MKAADAPLPCTPFDDAIAAIQHRGYHNHRLEGHSDIVSGGIYRDLREGCASLMGDVEKLIIQDWYNVSAPGARERKIDLFVGEPEQGADGRPVPVLNKLRLCIENKSVITAHRNWYSRFDDLNSTMGVVHSIRAEAVIVATVLVGTASRVLNIPDRVKAVCKDRKIDFTANVLPRLSTGDASLWTEFSSAVSTNVPTAARTTVDNLQQLPRRLPGHTHVEGYDYVLLVPVYIDNVNRPYVDRNNNLGINIDHDYREMLSVICKAYTMRWHP
jgi:hypothetical protein